ncbi:hypothetical protein FPOA_09359 [Fusarium poae]|uniref:Homeobox domain-containing protein n=1 Tax=Fusarium poae TaxID=36050 RepID=A0A1B8ARS3_FUSPO|nr:hypothetical protein FPOA_09359 [Fusarium poae]
MSLEEYTNVENIFYQPGDAEEDDISDLWDPDNDTIDPQQLNAAQTLDGVGQNHASNNPNQASEPFNGVLTDQKTATPVPQRPGKRLSLASVRVLNKWLSNHTHHPYPTVAEVESMIRQTGLSKQQVLNWFANARRRKKFERPDTTDYSSGSSEAISRDIPLQRPPTPAFQQSPFERWRNSPPEDEPSGMDAIARAASSVSRAPTEDIYIQHRNASSVTGSWATSAETSDSSRSSHASARTHGSDRSLESLRKANKKRRRARPRGRGYGTRQLNQAVHRYQCTFCTESFKLKHTWTRHEKTQHLSLEQWECTPTGSTCLNDSSEATCVYCGALNPGVAHFETHNHDLCYRRERSERTFYRKDHLRQHLRLVHGLEFRKWPMEDWRFKLEDIISRCGFCDANMTTWSERANHLAEHFKDGMTMADWKGNWGFDALTLEMLENSMPPYLIDYERNSPLPFTTSQGAPYSSTSAFELLQLELDYFYSNYVDANHTIPSDEILHVEACSVIFGAEISSHLAPQVASSWLRDLIMGTEHITAKARYAQGYPFLRVKLGPQLNGGGAEHGETLLESNTLPDLDILQQILSEEAGINTLGYAACGSSPVPSNQKVVSLNDGNMYRGLTRDLTRYVARTISPLNPTSHVPTDEELQYQARWIEYDSHDVWNQTPADNIAWLEEFKKASGFF